MGSLDRRAPGGRSTLSSELRDEVLQHLRETGLGAFAQEGGLLEELLLSRKTPEGPPARPDSPSGCSPDAKLVADETLAGYRGQSAEQVGVANPARRPDSQGLSAGPVTSDVCWTQQAGGGRSPPPAAASRHQVCTRTRGSRRGKRKAMGEGCVQYLPEAESRTAGGNRVVMKGLRHFSSKVCEKVETKRRTTYNEVADELVVELKHRAGDEKNIRRRVYDALNVLMAVGVFTKEKKDIFWRGLPDAPTCQLESMDKEKIKLAARISQKRAYLEELYKQYLLQKNLVERNRDNPLDFSIKQSHALQLPFLLVQVAPQASTDISMTHDHHDVYFDFQENKFQLHDDVHTLHFMAGNSSHMSDEWQGQGGVHRIGEDGTFEEVLSDSPGAGSSQFSTIVRPPCWPPWAIPSDIPNWFPSTFEIAAKQRLVLAKGPGGYRSFGDIQQFSPWLGSSYVPPMPNHA